MFDRWYSGLEYFKAVRALGLHFAAPVPSNRRIRLDGAPAGRVDRLPIAPSGTTAWLAGFGTEGLPDRRQRRRHGITEYWITDDPDLGEVERQALDERSWSIEEYHRGLKQH